MRLFVIFGVVTLFASAHGHTFHIGRCPFVRYMPQLDITRLMGVWYVIQKTTTGTNCVTYEFSPNDDNTKINLVQLSRNHLFGIRWLGHSIRYTGELEIPDVKVASYMTAHFPLSSAFGSSSFLIMTTDYTTYALIFTCQDLILAHRRSVSILSRTRHLDSFITTSLRSHLTYIGIDTADLSIVNQLGCPKHKNDQGIPTNLGVARRKLRSDLAKEWDFIKDANDREYYVEEPEYDEHQSDNDKTDFIVRY